MLSTITDALRAKFKDFKVRDLGYSQMRQYMASVGDYDWRRAAATSACAFPNSPPCSKISYSPIADTQKEMHLWKR